MTTPTIQELSTSSFSSPITLVIAGDLAADSRSQLVPVPAWATRAIVSIGCTGTGSPIGVIKIIGSAQGADATKTHVIATPATQPTGSAFTQLYVVAADAPYVGVWWDVTSGGTGAAWTGDAGAGSSPTITFME